MDRSLLIQEGGCYGFGKGNSKLYIPLCPGLEMNLDSTLRLVIMTCALLNLPVNMDVWAVMF
jgi:hypothetical protein